MDHLIAAVAPRGVREERGGRERRGVGRAAERHRRHVADEEGWGIFESL